MRIRPFIPGLAIVMASLLFATDALFREKALHALDPRTVSFLEHAIALLAILPWVLLKRRENFWIRGKKDWALFIVLGLGGGALGSALFTSAVEKIGSGGATLFTMLQPVFVLTLAWFFLKERFSQIFVPCAIWVVANMILLSFSQTAQTEILMSDENPDAIHGMLYAFAATLIWGASTVAGKALLSRHSNSVVLFWRFAIAAVFLGGFVLVRGIPLPWAQIFSWEILLPLLALGLVAQATAYSIYYVGLRQLPASLTTFIELLYPLVGIFLPVVVKGGSVTPLQGFASVTLLIAVSLLLGVEYPRAVRTRSS